VNEFTQALTIQMPCTEVPSIKMLCTEV